MKEKLYACTACKSVFKLTKDTNVATLREDITRHCFMHACHGEDATVRSTNYRADYTCITCGRVFNVGPKGEEAMVERINEHRNECECGAVIPAEFITQAEVDAYQNLNVDAGS